MPSEIEVKALVSVRHAAQTLERIEAAIERLERAVLTLAAVQAWRDESIGDASDAVETVKDIHDMVAESQGASTVIGNA